MGWAPHVSICVCVDSKCDTRTPRKRVQGFHQTPLCPLLVPRPRPPGSCPCFKAAILHFLQLSRSQMTSDLFHTAWPPYFRLCPCLARTSHPAHLKQMKLNRFNLKSITKKWSSPWAGSVTSAQTKASKSSNMYPEPEITEQPVLIDGDKESYRCSGSAGQWWRTRNAFWDWLEALPQDRKRENE